MSLQVLLISSLLYVSNGLLLLGKTLRTLEGKIVGGTPVDLELFPHIVQVYNRGNICAGSVLNSWTIMTAAHCFDLDKELDEIYVVAGSRFSFDLNSPMYYVTSIAIHENYNVSTHFACDIALMFVDRPIKFSKVTKKAVIVNTDKWMTPDEPNFIVTGWGQTSYNGELSKLGLLMTQLKFVSQSECSRLHNIMITEDMFCLYGDGIYDTCKGDSGGGVLWNDMIVGVTSHGDKCAKKNSPSIYTNVWYFRDWTKKQILIFVQNFCKKKIKRSQNDDCIIV